MNSLDEKYENGWPLPTLDDYREPVNDFFYDELIGTKEDINYDPEQFFDGPEAYEWLPEENDGEK